MVAASYLYLSGLLMFHFSFLLNVESKNKKFGNSLREDTLQALMNKSKFGVLYSNLPSKAFCQFTLAYSQSSLEKLYRLLL